MSRSSNAVVVFGILGVLLGVQRGYWAARVWLLPELTPGVVAKSTASIDAQRDAWLRYDEVLQCDALGPCIGSLSVSNWEGNPEAIASACQAAHDRIEDLEIPSELPAAVRSNVELLRTYWLRETSSYVTQAQDDQTDGGDWTALLTFTLDTCTPESIPAQIDQLYGVVPAGSAPATCAEVQARR